MDRVLRKTEVSHVIGAEFVLFGLVVGVARAESSCLILLSPDHRTVVCHYGASGCGFPVRESTTLSLMGAVLPTGKWEWILKS